MKDDTGEGLRISDENQLRDLPLADLVSPKW